MKSSELAKNVKNLWKTWDIRVLILFSMIIQILLTTSAPFRKRSSNSFLMFSIWILYLSADAIAVLVIGLISNNKGVHSPELLAFWAPFLLIHLGGPDTITALALEDNELWHRHALQLATQVFITVYVFSQSFQHNHDLLLPTLLMFFNGFIKYFERTCALFCASSDSFRDSLVSKPEPGPNYARLMEEYYSAKSAHIPTEFEGKDGPLEGVSKFLEGRRDSQVSKSSPTMDDNNVVTNNNGASNSTLDSSLLVGDEVKETDGMVKAAHRFYEMSKPLLTDGFLSLKDRDVSRKFFLDRPCVEVFRIIQIELNLIYDIFYTKLFLFQKKRAFVRVLCFYLALISLLVFCFEDWSKYHSNVDVIVTLILLGGAIALDLTAALIFVLSDWWVVLCYEDTRKNCLRSFMLMILRWSRWLRKRDHKRWCNSISKYNLLKRCFRKPPSFFNLTYLIKIKEIRDILVGLLYVRGDQFEEQFIKYVIEGLQSKAKQANEMTVAKQVCSARGNLVLQTDYYLASECLSPWTVDVDYDESLLIWHLATDICYWTTTRDDKDDGDDSESKARRFSKALADYMAYVLLRQQKMVSALVGMSETRFEDTCAEAKKFMNNKCININWLAHPWWKVKRFVSMSRQDSKSPSENAEAEFFKEFSKKVLEVRADVQPLKAKGDKSKSVLFDACRLAKQLELFGEKQWEITSKVWVELLCYAAVRCSPTSHIARLSKGGELITLVWLFMTHLGLGERFLQNQGFGWTKLIIHK